MSEIDNINTENNDHSVIDDRSFLSAQIQESEQQQNDVALDIEWFITLSSKIDLLADIAINLQAQMNNVKNQVDNINQICDTLQAVQLNNVNDINVLKNHLAMLSSQNDLNSSKLISIDAKVNDNNMLISNIEEQAQEVNQAVSQLSEQIQTLESLINIEDNNVYQGQIYS